MTRSLAAAVLTAAVLTAVPALAQAAAAPSLAWSPTTSSGTYGYAPVTVGQIASQTFMLTNNGGKASSALKVTLGGSAAFSLTADTCTATSLGPRKSCRITVRFAPTSSGTDTATLSAHSKKLAAAAMLSLTAIGTVPGRIYWSDNGAGMINEANLDGTNPHTLVTGRSLPLGLAVSESRERVGPREGA